jgi:uncharacterized protein YqjF (DUF2071 family)
MIMIWERLAFVHWACEPADVQHTLPDGLEVDTFDGAAWIGLIPFVCRIRLPGTPFVPWASTFDEINLRTYVRGSDGNTGIWFFSLEAARLGAVLGARASWRIPYMWSQMRTSRPAGTAGPLQRVRYESSRRWPGLPPSQAARSDVDLALGEEVLEDERTERDRFLTDRYRLYSPASRGIATAVVEHKPWPLRRARIVRLEETLSRAAGVPSAAGADDASALFSPGVETRFGARTTLPASRRTVPGATVSA